MTSLLSILKWIDAPGSIPFLIMCVAAGIGLALAWPRHRRLAGTWMGVVGGGYLLLALPWVASGIAGALPVVTSPTIAPGQRLDALVVFDGDNRRGRVRETRRLYDAARPEVVWSLGREDWMEGALPRAGIPRDRVKHDRTTTTTREQIAWLQRFVQTGDHRSIAVVASRLQMPRIDALFLAAGLHPLLATSAADTEPATSGFRQFVPTYFALRISRDALYEHIALWYYRHNGWIR